MLRLKDSIKTFLQEGRGSDWFSLITVRHTTKNPLTYTTLVSICPHNRKAGVMKSIPPLRTTTTFLSYSKE